MMRPRGTVRAFTLIELMVTVAIIALLITIALPAFNKVREEARKADTRAMFGAIDSGQETFKGEQAIGGRYIPSASDSQFDANLTPSVYGQIMDPHNTNSPPAANRINAVPGISLLVYGLLGADLSGTAGFRDLNGNRLWYDDFGNNYAGANPPPPPPGGPAANGLYSIHNAGPNAGTPVHPRYSRLVADQIAKRVVTFEELLDDRVILNRGQVFTGPSAIPLANQAALVDAWGRPMLYYGAKQNAKVMLTGTGAGAPAGGPTPGIYDQRDNQLITGIQGAGTLAPDRPGMNLGAGLVIAPDLYHRITKYKFAEPLYSGGTTVSVVDTDTSFDDTFTRYIWDKTGHSPVAAQNVQPRNLPVRPDSYLLISAGPDAIFGTGDDVANWDRQ